jgi:hypothetical protein
MSFQQSQSDLHGATQMSMDRRQFLKRAALIAAGAVAADQLELFDRLGWKRKFFPGFSSSYPLILPSNEAWYVTKEYALSMMVTEEMAKDDKRFPSIEAFMNHFNQTHRITEDPNLDVYHLIPRRR